jgi:hypothetical protein
VTPCTLNPTTESSPLTVSSFAPGCETTVRGDCQRPWSDLTSGKGVAQVPDRKISTSSFSPNITFAVSERRVTWAARERRISYAHALESKSKVIASRTVMAAHLEEEEEEAEDAREFHRDRPSSAASRLQGRREVTKLRARVALSRRGKTLKPVSATNGCADSPETQKAVR